MSSQNKKVWLHGLLAAVISGAAGSFVTCLSAIGIAPTHFNFSGGFKHVVGIMLLSALFHAGIGVFMYLQKSPLPDPDPTA
jgi:hypothetical protein